MKDEEMLALFEARSQEALSAVRAEYGPRLLRLAENVTGSWQDAEECVNDGLLVAWNKIPPAHPVPLLPWLYAAVRHLALRKARDRRALKRGGPGIDLAVEELDQLLGSDSDPQREVELRELRLILERFVRRLPKRDRLIFLGRYWYGESYDTIALRLNMTENNCAVRMSLIRKKLRKALEKEGVL